MYQVSIIHPLKKKKKKKKPNKIKIHSRAKTTKRQNGIIIIINILYKSYKQIGKKITATSYI